MVVLLNEFPDHVAAYKATGAISQEEYEEVVMSRVDEVASRYERINFLVYLETDMSNYSIGAFLKYLKVSFEHFTKWNRMAIITDEKWLRSSYEVIGILVHGTIKTYVLKDFEAAKQWVSEPINADT
jgi:hypothetical protein